MALYSSETSTGFHWDTRRYVPGLFEATALRNPNATKFGCIIQLLKIQILRSPRPWLLMIALGCNTVYFCRTVPLKWVSVKTSLKTSLYHLTFLTLFTGGMFLRTFAYAYKTTRCHSPDQNLNWWRYFHDMFQKVITLGYKSYMNTWRHLKNRRNVGL
jgi:hypothetical protein